MKLAVPLTVACAFAFSSGVLGAPPVKTEARPVTEVYGGVTVEDPYRWLETPVKIEDPTGVEAQLLAESKAVRDWVESQNKVTFGYLEAIPERKIINEKLTALWDYEKYAGMFKAGGRYYFFKNSGLQNQFVMYTMDTLGGEPRVVIDPNTLSADGTVALAGYTFSDDGNWMAYGLSKAGSDWSEWRVRDLRTGKDLPEVLNWIKFSGASFTLDGRGFFYTRFPEPPAGKEFTALNYYSKIYYHRLGTSQSDDVLVYERTRDDEKEWGVYGGVTEDGRYFIISTGKGTDPKNHVAYRDLADPLAAPVHLVSEFENEYEFVGNDGPLFYFKTDYKSPLGSVIAIDTRKPQRENWKTIVPEAAEALQGVSLVNNTLICQYLRDASSAVRLFTLEGKHLRDVQFPTFGTAGGFGGKRTDTETFYTFSSFAVPPSLYRYDMLTGESTLVQRAKVNFDPDQYETKQVFYSSKDGARVPMFLVHKKGLALDGSNPTLLYGYGGFNISLTPTFSISRLLWVQMGGVFAMPNIRGGGEYGRAWNEAGKLKNKQNCFNDFIAAAEWLVENRYTSPAKLAIQGGSNGGLLVGAMVTQRPDLFGAALPAVGVMDMMRFHKFSAGRYWVDEYGSADDPEMAPVLLAYSPYHNLKKGTKYPATMVTTADTDDRVVPGHSFKFAAAMQEAQGGDAPILIRIETSAGHGAGKPTAKIIEEVADQWAFLVKSLGVTLPPEFCE